MTPADLRSRRDALGLSQAQLAQRLGVRQSEISRWETTGPSAQRITRQRAAWLDLELSRLERERVAVQSP